jgi:hypothetical protein
MTSIWGIDVAKAKVDVVLLVEGQAPLHAEFDNTAQGFKQLKRWLDNRSIERLHACLEATGNFGDEVATFLHTAGYTVSGVNPARISAYAKSQLRRNQTDKLDAALIAELCRTQTPPAWSPPDPAWKELQGLVRHLQDLETARQAAKNRLSAQPASPAVVAKHHNPILSAFAARLAQRGLAGTQIIVAVMRKLVHLAFGILKAGQPFDPYFLLKAAPCLPTRYLHQSGGADRGALSSHQRGLYHGLWGNVQAAHYLTSPLAPTLRKQR